MATTAEPDGLTSSTFSSGKHVLLRHDSGQEPRSLQDFSAELHNLFGRSLSAASLHAISLQLQNEYRQKLDHSPISMLPSFHQVLPSGSEHGTFISLDIGGSNLRVATVDLHGRKSVANSMVIKHNKTFRIDSHAKALRGELFFDWVAERVREVLDEDRNTTVTAAEPISMGLAWSFPIDQTSTRSGRLLQMGKGFAASDGLQDQDLGVLITEACKRKGLDVNLRSIVNDASATLLAQAYQEPSTRFSLILGTGVNSAAFLPLTSTAIQKYGNTPPIWHNTERNVIVNTELSMHGLNIWPITRWDKSLNDNHILPNFQPLEQKTSGMYLGEIARLVLIEAIETANLFNGALPKDLDIPYALSTSLLAEFESDTSQELNVACRALMVTHPLDNQPSVADLYFVKTVSQLVSRRAAAYVATAVHALCSLSTTTATDLGEATRHVTIACDGSVLEKYPGFLQRCQQDIDALGLMSGPEAAKVSLAIVRESCIFGAAVAAACD